jgi:predicted ester cyclase
MEASSSTAEENAAKTRQYYDRLWNQRDLTVIPDWVTEDFIGHHTARPEPVRGIDGFRAFAEEMFVAFPDLRMTVEDTIAQGDRVASRVSLEGTHRGELSGYAPTGLAVKVGFLGIERYVDGRCAEEWVYSDDMGIARQIKALPEVGSRGERLGIRLHRLSTRRLRKAL